MTDWDHGNVYVRRVVSGAGAVFLPWYLWSLAYYPEPLLWWCACAVSLVCVIAALRWPRSVLYWLAPGIMLFNHLHFWLPWPYVKLAYICPAAVCVAAALRSWHTRSNAPLRIHTWFTVWFLCMVTSAGVGVLRRWCAQEPAAWHELARHLRLLPFLDEWNPYVPLRYVWVWSLALLTYVVLLPLVRRVRDVRTVVWSIVISSLPAALFGMYSYLTRTYMVSHYIMERRISATFSSPAVLADMLTVACVCGAYLLYTTPRCVLRILLAGIMVCDILAVLYSGCRVNMAVLALGLLLVVLTAIGLYGWMRRRWWLVPVGAVCLASATAAAWRYAPAKLRAHLHTVPAIERTHLMVERWRTTNAPLWKRVHALLPGRISHWAAAARMLRQHPLWGIGAGLFESSYVRFRARDDLFVYARAHNIFLRIAAEGGIVTCLAFIAVVATLAHTLHTCRGNARACDVAWLQLRRAFCSIAVLLLITSFFSDIWLENIESVMMLAVLMALGTTVCRALAPAPEDTDQEVWPSELSWRQRMLAAVHERLMLLTWGWVGLVSLRRVVLFLCTASICLLGLRRAFYDGRKTLLRGEAVYGFVPATQLVKSPGEWFAFSRSAMRSVIVPGTVLRVTLQPLNERMAREAPRVSVWVNNVLMGHVWLSPGAHSTLYCDLSALRNDVAVIRFVADRTFCPWRLAWFKDSFSYGGVCSALEWLHQDPLMAFTHLDGLWNAHWTAHASTYYALGHTNLHATVRVPFHVLDPL